MWVFVDDPLLPKIARRESGYPPGRMRHEPQPSTSCGYQGLPLRRVETDGSTSRSALLPRVRTGPLAPTREPQAGRVCTTGASPRVGIERSPLMDDSHAHRDTPRSAAFRRGRQRRSDAASTEDAIHGAIGDVFGSRRAGLRATAHHPHRGIHPRAGLQTRWGTEHRQPGQVGQRCERGARRSRRHPCARPGDAGAVGAPSITEGDMCGVLWDLGGTGSASARGRAVRRSWRMPACAFRCPGHGYAPTRTKPCLTPQCRQTMPPRGWRTEPLHHPHPRSM